MDRLRMECFPGNYPTGSAKDEFDDRSIHIVTRAEDQLAGYGRLTAGPKAFFEVFYQRKAIIPTGPDVVDFGRVMVALPHRGHDLFELILIEGLILACDLGFRCVVGSSRTDRRFRPFIHDLGFTDSGPAVPIYLPSGVVEPGQPVVAQTAGKRDGWYARKVATLHRLREKGYEIVDDGCAADLF
jgi:hypothetical protein